MTCKDCQYYCINNGEEYCAYYCQFMIEVLRLQMCSFLDYNNIVATDCNGKR